MPWRTTCPMDERTQFIAAWLAHEESMSELCRRFRISRKTGYKVLGRYAAASAVQPSSKPLPSERKVHTFDQPLSLRIRFSLMTRTPFSSSA